jgi:hypothetical protein
MTKSELAKKELDRRAAAVEAGVCDYLHCGKCVCRNWLFFHCRYECLRRGLRRDDAFLRELLAGDGVHRFIDKKQLESDKIERESRGVFV